METPRLGGGKAKTRGRDRGLRLEWHDRKCTTLVVPNGRARAQEGLQPLRRIKMARPSHSRTNQRTFFITSSTWERRQLFRSERLARLFIEVLMDYRSHRKYLLHEFVLMPDHFHLLLTLEQAVTVERAVQFIKGSYSFRAKKELDFHGEIWQQGFTEHIVKTKSDFEQHRGYILRNPVKAGLAQRAEEYAYCSACPVFKLDPPPSSFRG